MHATGGLSAWAHPEMTAFERDIERFAEWGLVAVAG
jgi:hypothetical protein